MRLTRRASLLVAFSLLTSAVTASSEPCEFRLIKEMDASPSAQMPLGLSATEIGHLRTVATEEATRLGYTPSQMKLEIWNLKGRYVAYLAPTREGALGGDLTLFLTKTGRVICFHEGM